MHYIVLLCNSVNSSDFFCLQAIKQAYVLVLGLDVLGNPFGLIEGLADGAKGLFYEPIQGAIQGPEEFAEGLALGLRSLLSGTLGMCFSSIWSNE